MANQKREARPKHGARKGRKLSQPAAGVPSGEESPRSEGIEAYRDDVPAASADQDFLLESGNEARRPTQASDHPLDISPTAIVDGEEAGVTLHSDEAVLAEYEEAVRESMRRD